MKNKKSRNKVAINTFHHMISQQNLISWLLQTLYEI